MPNFLAADSGDSSRSRSRQRARTEVGEHRSVWDRLNFQKIGSWLKRDEEPQSPTKEAAQPGHDKEDARPHSSGEHASRHGGLLNRRSSRKVVPGLPRPLTFKRMNSEKREKLLEVPVSPEQRRAASADRRASSGLQRQLSPPPVAAPSMSAPDVLSPPIGEAEQRPHSTIGGDPDSNIPAGSRQVDYGLEESIDYLSMEEPPPLSMADDDYLERDSQRSASDVDDLQLQEELEAKWILNLSMHFRDMSDREKFSITFAEEPNKWRRVTVSIDYRELAPESLEADLKSLHYQRDKSARIYESIRDSLPDIQFYETVTNLKLQTADGRLHVHVTEDVNEIIPYPSLSALDHLDCKRFRESAICFDSHISGFVYKVSVGNKMYIKKEIPGPDAVEEFLYEINALCSLSDSKSVIKFEGIIIDEKSELIKGLLISYAEQGALVDLIYDFKNTEQMNWERREKWAKQIVEGLSEIHEASFVQGDFTLSNIVINHDDNAKIIDINRRGRPVGWEPPELARLIESGQRISIYIGVKSDLFQLGMVLWALAVQEDEPERQERPLARSLNRHNTVPEYFKNIVEACLSDKPRDRPAAKDLLQRFPDRTMEHRSRVSYASRQSNSPHRDKVYIDPRTAVGLDDIPRRPHHSPSRSSFSHVNMPSTEYIASPESQFLPNPAQSRGRSPNTPRSDSQRRRSEYSPYPAPQSVMSFDDSELENELASLPASRDTRWEQVYVDGDTKLVQRGCAEIDVQDFAIQEPKDVCITTPPDEIDSSLIASKHSDETSLSLSTTAGLPLYDAQHSGQATGIRDESYSKSVESKTSFSERVHQLVDLPTSDERAAHISNPAALTDLEKELAYGSSVPSSSAPSRVGTGFSEIFARPTHKDSGFSEPLPERISFDNERIRKSLEATMADIQHSFQEDQRVNEQLWDEKDVSIGHGVRGEQLVLRADSLPVPQTISNAPNFITEHGTSVKPLEGKSPDTTSRPPGILIPNFHHAIPKAVDPSPPIYTPASSHRAAPADALASSYTSTSSTSRSICSFDVNPKV